MAEPTVSQTCTGAVLCPGQVVGGRYRVERLLAEGGMAAVWAGTNGRTGKRVALKVILSTFAATADVMELFRREALAASKVNHPNVVSIFDVIDHEGMTCIVMELLEGETLEAYLGEHGCLVLEEAAALLLPAMRGVAAANAMGIVHRDLKPGNLFLCKDPEGRLLTTKVLDFGISMSAERTVEQEVRFGTPAYMAPEDIVYPQVVDSRTDVYGFGVLLFETLTGQVPFPGEPNEALLTRILRQPPPKVTAYRSDLPPAVQQVLDRTLAKDPADRFPDVDHLIRAIEDNLLPPLPVRRSLSPIAGVAFLPRSQSTSAPAALPVQEPGTASPPARAGPGATRALVSLAVDESRAAPAHGSAASDPLHRKIRSRLSLDILPHRGMAWAALIVATSVTVLWFALRKEANIERQSTRPAMEPLQGPVITPLPVPLPSRRSAPLADTEHERETFEGSAQAKVGPTPVPLEPGQVAPAGATVAERPPSRARGIPRAEPRSQRRQPSARPDRPRAGKLSSADF
jgi:serine/threonine protein kinase